MSSYKNPQEYPLGLDISSGEIVDGTIVNDDINSSAAIAFSKLEATPITELSEDTTPQLGGALDGQGNDLNNLGVVFLTEQADAEGDVAGKGQIWVDTATPNILSFTDDAGNDFQVAGKGVPLLFQKEDTGTIATTGSSYGASIAPLTGTLVAVYFNPADALAANDTNYITFKVINQGAAGAGTTAMLAETDVNTTKATGGTALSATTNRTLTIHGTAANLAVTAGDRILVQYEATGTLANTVSNTMIMLVWGK